MSNNKYDNRSYKKKSNMQIIFLNKVQNSFSSNKKSNFLKITFFSALIFAFLLSSAFISFNFNSDAQVLFSEVKVQAAEKMTVAFVPRSLDNPIFLDAFEEAQKKADDLEINLEWVAPFVYNADEQINILDALIERDVDGIIVSVNNTEKYIDIINKAMENGIAVATFDADAPDSNRIFHVGINNFKAGQAAAEGLLNILEEKDIDYKNDNEELSTMVMTGVRGAENLEQRISGFRSVVEESNIEVKDILENQDSVNISVELLEQYLEEKPEVDIIYFVGGWPFYVPAEALPNFQRWVKNGGIAVGIDIFYDALLLQQQGLVKFLVGQDMSSMGSEAISLMFNYLKYDIKPAEINYTGLEFSDGSNIERLLQIHKPWRVK